MTFLDSTGVGVLVSGRRQLGEGGTVRVVSTRPAIVKLFELTGLTEVLPVYSTIDDALY